MQTQFRRVAKYTDHVFVNCPFDADYKPMFDAIVFAVTDLGLVARSAREEDDGGESRLVNIQRIIEQCKYGVHDISAVELDSRNNLPRFNMPLELGLFLGCKRYGNDDQRNKVSLIFDADPFRYQKFISDIAGQDIHSHDRDLKTAISELRAWLATASNPSGLPSGKDLFDRSVRFQADLPALCKKLKLEPAAVTFKDLRQVIVGWLKEHR